MEWLSRPILAFQSRPLVLPTKLDCGSVLSLPFLFLVVSCPSTGFSPLLNPSRTVRSSACKQFLARPSGSIPISFKSRLQLSLKSSTKGPARLYIVASAPLMMSFGMHRAPLGAVTQNWQAVLA